MLYIFKSLSFAIQNVINMKVLFFIVLITSVYGHPCSISESLNITEGVVLQNGSVVFDGLEYASSVWYEIEEDGVTSRMGCPCIGRPCLRKCCPLGQGYTGACVPSDLGVVNPFSPPLFRGDAPVDTAAHEHFFYFPGQANCEEKYMVVNSAREKMYIQENGTLFEKIVGHSTWHDYSRYCVDMMVKNGSDPFMFAAVCYGEDPTADPDSPILHITYAIGLLLSVPFLLATFAVYALIPELRNLHGLCLMAYCAGLIVAYVFLAFLKLHTNKNAIGMAGCVTIAVIVYYAFQTSFFWLNIMCFDIWRTFSGYRGGGSNKRRERRRFALYGAYAWGVPLLLTAGLLAMQYAVLPDSIIKPGFGDRKCWFPDWLSNLLYFYAPVLILVACNVVLFSITAHRIRSIRQETAILKGSESARSDRLKKDKQRYGLYLKLFVVMGVNWSVELISFAVGGSSWYFILTDLSNISLGFFIFFIFVWKKKVRNLVARRFRSMFGMAAPAPDMRKSPWTSSTHTEDTRVSASTDDPSIRLKDLR